MGNTNSNHINHINHIKGDSNHIKGDSNPCIDKLTDIQYLEHMIPHHQVAVDMSDMLIPHTNNPSMLNLCREIKRVQEYEIWEMEKMKKKLSDTMSSNNEFIVDKDNAKTKLDIWDPKMSKSKDGGCNPLFFKPNDHSQHMKHMKITDKSYLEHMIPHHQVAIDMSKRLLLHTNNTYLITFCRKLIIDQQGEIYYMNNLLKNKYIHHSPLLSYKEDQVSSIIPDDKYTSSFSILQSH
jgi:uncharacterized protein (DUF305 family)